MHTNTRQEHLEEVSARSIAAAGFSIQEQITFGLAVEADFATALSYSRYSVMDVSGKSRSLRLCLHSRSWTLRGENVRVLSALLGCHDEDGPSGASHHHDLLAQNRHGSILVRKLWGE